MATDFKWALACQANYWQRHVSFLAASRLAGIAIRVLLWRFCILSVARRFLNPAISRPLQLEDPLKPGEADIIKEGRFCEDMGGWAAESM